MSIFKGAGSFVPEGLAEYNLVQTPDPAANFKVPERAAFQKFHEQLQVLTEFMRKDLNGRST